MPMHPDRLLELERDALLDAGPTLLPRVVPSPNPLPDGARRVSRMQMGLAESSKAPQCSFVRIGADGREWIFTGLRWYSLNVIENDATDFNRWLFDWR